MSDFSSVPQVIILLTTNSGKKKQSTNQNPKLTHKFHPRRRNISRTAHFAATDVTSSTVWHTCAFLARILLPSPKRIGAKDVEQKPSEDITQHKKFSFKGSFESWFIFLGRPQQPLISPKKLSTNSLDSSTTSPTSLRPVKLVSFPVLYQAIWCVPNEHNDMFKNDAMYIEIGDICLKIHQSSLSRFLIICSWYWYAHVSLCLVLSISYIICSISCSYIITSQKQTESIQIQKNKIPFCNFL